MKSSYDQAQDVLKIDISDHKPAVAQKRPDSYTVLGYADDDALVQITLAQAKRRGLMPVRTTGKAPFTVGWSAWRSFVSEYSILTRLATLLLIAAALLSIAKAFPCTPPGCLPPNWVEALSSDGMLTLLTLAVAFGVGIHIKLRLERGLLDGAEHYSIGRALAYGYFSNFLLIALMQLRTESRRRGLPKGKMLKLKIVFPATPADLEAFKAQVANSRYEIKRVDIAAPEGSSKVLQRSMSAIVGAGQDAASSDMFIDFPTTLYTVQDYLETWDVWLKDRNRAPLGHAEIERLYKVQVEQFFGHLFDLSQHKFGLAAARRVGFGQLTEEELASVFEDHLERIEGSTLLQALA